MTAGTRPESARWWDDPLEVGRELTLLGLNVAAVFSLGRLFVGTDHLAPLLITAVVAHSVLMLIRRTGRSLALAALITPVAAIIMSALVFQPGSTVLGIPTPSSFDLMATDLDVAFSLFGDTPTPTEPVTGFLILCAAALWVSAFVADWAGFRLGLPVEAVLPTATVFVFAAVLADDHQRTFVSVVSSVAVLSFFLMHRVARQARDGQWVAGTSARGSAALVGMGTSILVVAVLAASFSGPSLPGAGADPLIQLEPDAPSKRVTVSPLVDIRGRLVEQANVEVFTVESDQRAYWRLTSLDSFNGREWTSSGSYGRAEGGLESSAPVASADSASQTFQVNALAAIWLPAAFEPRAVDADLDLRYDELSSTLIVDTDIPDSDGITYRVESDLPQYDPEVLGASIRQYPNEISETQLELPADFPDSVRQLAVDVTAGDGPEPFPYVAALRLQEHLRTFTYDLSVPSGHGGDDLERFLLVDQAGYCEQFAGSFAALARSIGVPARVAVGFTPGIEVEPGRYSVRGEHAHAWPEVYFAGIGWVPFEPTPGRGAPGGESHTGVPEQQVQSGGDPNTATTLAPPTTAPNRETVDPEADLSVEAATPETVPAPGTAEAAASADQSNRVVGWFVWVAVSFGVVLLVAALYIAIAFGLHRRRTHRRRDSAETPTDRVELAWRESLEHLGMVGFDDDPSATHVETAERATRVLPSGAEQARTIGVLAETAVYGPSGIGETEAETAEEAAEEIGQIVHAVTSVSTRSRPVLAPRTVLGVGPIRQIGRDEAGSDAS